MTETKTSPAQTTETSREKLTAAKAEKNSPILLVLPQISLKQLEYLAVYGRASMGT